MLLCTELTEAHWRRAFQAYVDVNHSHWTGPPYAFVRKMLDEQGAYEFSVPSLGTWTSRFRLERRPDGIHVVFVKNPDLSGRMAKKLDEMEAAFGERLHQA